MKVEMLKNKKTNKIEKLIINNNKGFELKDIKALELEHKDTLINLSNLDIKWHEMFMNYRHGKNIIEIKKELYKDFDNRNVTYVFDQFTSYHKNNFNDIKYKPIDRWFFNYYSWTVFYSVVKGLKNKGLVKAKDVFENDGFKIVDPTILLMVQGISYFEKLNICNNLDKNNQILDMLLNMRLDDNKDKVFRKIKELEFQNEDLNLFMFQKEVLSISEDKDNYKYFWNLKKNLVNQLMIDFVTEKIHYSH